MGTCSACACLKLAGTPRIVEQGRARWSPVRIILRGDSGFCRDELMKWAKQQPGTRALRVVAKAEHLEGKENPRYGVTSLAPEPWPARQLYEQLYCARRDMENRIKEQFHLFAGRATSTWTMRQQRSNGLRPRCRRTEAWIVADSATGTSALE